MLKKLMSLVVMTGFLFTVVQPSAYARTVVNSGTVSATTALGSNNTVANSGGGYYVTSSATLSVGQGVNFANNTVTGSGNIGGALCANGGNIAFATGATGIVLSNNYDIYTGTGPGQSRANDMYLINTSYASITGSGNVSFNSGIGSDGSSVISKTSTGNMYVADASAFTGTINQSGGTSSITNIGSGGRINYAAGTTNTFGGTTAAGAVIANNGILTYINGTNNGTINSNGNLTVSGTLYNNGTISQQHITNNGTLFSSLSTLNSVSGFITNQGTFNVSGTSTLNQNISGNGTLVLTNASNTTVSASAQISQSILQIDSTASLTTNANNLFLGTLRNNGTLTLTGGILNENMTGTGNTLFTGNTVLTGINAGNSGNMTLNGGNVTIADGNNLSSGNIVFNAANVLNVTGADAVINNNFSSATSNITINNSGNLLLTGSISSTGANFVKNGAGNITFDKNMSNAYVNTVINGGLLSGYYGNIMGNINGAGSVEFLDEYAVTPTVFNKLVAISGNFIKSGSAIFDVRSASFNASNIVLDGGTFLANAAINAVNNVDVNDGAVLGGTGSVTATAVNINDGGTLSAGNSIGELDITGNLNFFNGSTNLVETEQTDIYYGLGSRADKVNVTNGTVEMHTGSKLDVVNTAGRYFVHEAYDIITTNPADILGEFDSPATVTGFDDFRIETDVEYNTTDGKVVLNVKRIRTNYENDVYGLTHNQKRTAKGIDAVSTGYGGDLVDVLLAIEDMHFYNRNDAALAKAMDDISGSVYANALMIPYFNAKKDKIYDRMYIKDVKHKENKEDCSCYDCSHNLWIEYSGSYNTVDADSNSRNYANTSNGVLAGYDRSSVISNLVAGVFAGYSSIELSQTSNANYNDKITSDAFTAGVYGGKIGTKWDFSGVLSGSYFNNEAKRRISFMDRTAESSFGQTNVALDLKAAYKAVVSSKVQISPFVGFLSNYTIQDKIKERSAGSLNLDVDSQDMLNLEARLGVALKCQYSKFGWYVTAAASQMFTDGYGSIDAKLRDSDFSYSDASFNGIRGADRGQTFFDYSLGADYKLSNKWTLYANLLGDLSENAAGYYGSLGVMLKL